MLTPEREAQLLAENEALKAENKLLRQKIDLLVRRVFGSSKETLNDAQLELLLGHDPGKVLAPAGIAAEPSPTTRCAPTKKRETRPRLPEHLPVEEEVIVPLEVQAQPEAWKRIGEEVTEQLDYRPARYIRRVLVRPKYVPVGDKSLAPVIAPLPAQLQEGCLATPAMIAHVVVAKYVDHLPLYRQEQILRRRHDLNLPRQTLNRWVLLAADSLRLVYERVRTTVMEGGYVQVDETPIRYLEPGHGKCRTGYLWTTHRPGWGTVYQWHPSRAAECLQKVLPRDYAGVVQCDGYAAYPAHARGRDITLAGCWAHVRRKFYEAADQDRRMVFMVWLIDLLYALERPLRSGKVGATLRAVRRQHQARPLLRRIHQVLLLWQRNRTFLPRSGAGRAVDYALSMWTTLQVYVDDGRVDIDNNPVENSIRPTAVGKKNWLFIGAEGAGQASAILFTLVEECRRLDINPQDYLTLALARIPTATTLTVGGLTPRALAPLLKRTADRALAQAA